MLSAWADGSGGARFPPLRQQRWVLAGIQTRRISVIAISGSHFISLRRARLAKCSQDQTDDRVSPEETTMANPIGKTDKQTPGVYRRRIGDALVTTINDGFLDINFEL